ncbi:lipoprotein insertase outer membrane protein LolB [Pollutimonas thiosulfatoxidans]|uniref:Outer-membrane lipoprotein LolB n=1 Tax=Pollutimonas thiosulfatoxidans TaxID=2028345 RepID=A0A410G8A7_9BURK|nr:lipoprotein insertase outer membrane protein LolB [Pollutimonas thiosulfatoxidans]QAA92506.1 outer membrane lipoprotein LolB [Pollutimonas thiosulfatoxidans]
MMLALTRFRAVACAVLAALLLAACATPTRHAQQADGPAFDRAGRFAVSVVYFNGKRDAVQGGFVWRDTGRELLLDLANPLGSTLARVQVLPGRAVLTRSNGQVEHADHPDALVEQALGSPIPVSGLRDWLRGRTGNDPVSDLRKDDGGNIASFTQNGWRVQLSRYDDQGPRLLQMNRNDANRAISARLVADGS